MQTLSTQPQSVLFFNQEKVVSKAATRNAHILYEHTSIPGCSTWIRLPADAPGRAAEVGPGAWALLPMWETQMEFLSSWLQPSPGLAVDATWVVNQQMKVHPLPL